MGPVQLLIVGFEDPDFRGEIAAELERLRELETIRVLDVIIVAKDEGAGMRVVEMAPGGADGGGELVMRLLDGGDADLSHLDDADPEQLWNAADAIPAGAVAAVVLIEHQWAIPLRDAIQRAGGFPIADAWLAPEDVASLGLPAQ
jgi:hypothetical protein